MLVRIDAPSPLEGADFLPGLLQIGEVEVEALVQSAGRVREMVFVPHIVRVEKGDATHVASERIEAPVACRRRAGVRLANHVDRKARRGPEARDFVAGRDRRGIVDDDDPHIVDTALGQHGLERVLE